MALTGFAPQTLYPFDRSHKKTFLLCGKRPKALGMPRVVQVVLVNKVLKRIFLQFITITIVVAMLHKITAQYSNKSS